MEVKIEVPQGFEIDKDKSTFEKIVFKEIENKLPISFEEINIDWANIVGAKNIKHNNYGKPYNADAPAEAAQKLVDYVDEIVEFGGGDYSISKLGKSKIVKKDSVVGLEKKYKF